MDGVEVADEVPGLSRFILAEGTFQFLKEI